MKTKPPRGTRLNIAHPLARGLVLYQVFNEGIGTKTFDLSLNSNHGTFGAGAAAPTWKAGRAGHSLYFDGGDYIDCENGVSLNITGAITVSAWVKRSTFGGDDYIVSKYTTTNDKRSWSIRFHGVGAPNKITIVLCPDGTWGTCYDAHGNTIITDSNWHHVSFSYNGAAVELFLDGIKESLDAAGSIPASLYATSAPVAIGARNIDDTSVDFFNGTIDEIMIYNRALSAAEIAKHYREQYSMFL